MAVLVVLRDQSYCSACGGNASPQTTKHIVGGRGGMYDPESHLGKFNGCGEEFTAVTTPYAGEAAEAATKKQCPDLPFVPFLELQDHKVAQ